MMGVEEESAEKRSENLRTRVFK